MTDIILDSPDALAALIPDGASIVLAKEPQAPTALAAALIRRGARDLHLITLPTAGYVADLLIGAGAVRLVETSGVSLGEFGAAPRFIDAVKTGKVEIRDSTCPAIYAALQAGEKGQPFTTLRGLVGSDVLAHRADYMVIDNPLAPGDPVVVMPAIRPDFALLHAELADVHGNVWVGGRHEFKTMAHAAHETLITVEEIWDGDLKLDRLRAPNLVTPLYTRAIAAAPCGAWPTAAGDYDVDADAMRAYAAAARTEAGFADWLARHIPARDAA